jgi:shikimate kinase
MPVHQRGLLLVGMRGAGKSAAGRAAAALAHLDFIDLDDRALALCGSPDVAAAFAAHDGAARWRTAERDALEALVGGACPTCIVAIGAGAPEHAPTAAVIRRARSGGWRVVHMRASAQVCASRVAADPGGRPALTPAGLLGEIATLHARRTPVYESLCDLAVDADRALADVARSIARAASDS